MPTAINTTDPIVFLIGEELKSRRFFNTLLELGLNDSYYQPHLDQLILKYIGLTDDRNETFDFYSSVMNTHAEKIGIKIESVTEHALQAYQKLVEYRQTNFST